MGWKFWIDRGGTFTDIVARRPDGTLVVEKLLSEAPERYSDATLAGIRKLLGLGLDAPIPLDLVDEVRVGTTVATNALLERTGVPTLLVVNSGFADLLDIARQTRPELFALNIRKPPALHARVLEVSARVDVSGCVLSDLDEGAAFAALIAARRDGLVACAIALIHAWRFPAHEQRLAELARRAGFTQVSVSSSTSPLIGLIARAQTTVVDAYLSPVLEAHVARLAATLTDQSVGAARRARAQLGFMTSNGGLAPPHLFRGKDAILSGPAGGVVGAVRAGEAAGFRKIIGFDMGGTSTDVSLYAGRLERTFETEVAGCALQTPMMAVHTVAAGGGSILAFDGVRLRVGPASAGADPGPACYRRGGPLTITDANLLLGKIQAKHFPALFGPEGDEPLDEGGVLAQFEALSATIAQATNQPCQAMDIAEGFVRIAVSNMARAISEISLEKGHDPTDFVLQAFGGAAGQHACLVAEELGVATVLLHPFGGVLSAYGIGCAAQSQLRRCAIERPLNEASLRFAIEALADLEKEAASEFDCDRSALTISRSVGLRYVGTDTLLETPLCDLTELQAAFDAEHRQVFGFSTPGRELVLASCTSEITLASEPVALPGARVGGVAPEAIDHVKVWTGGRPHEAPIFDRADLRLADRIPGPAIIREAVSTIVVEPGWTAEIAPDGTLVLSGGAPKRMALATNRAQANPVLLELFSNQFMAAAERMGAVLRNTSTSINIRERLDFSCAVFDAAGNLVANAPHVPVHLGAMGESVRAVLRARGGSLRPGDMVALNDPSNGGTHLPDVTLIAPVFDPGGTELRFFVGNRGHHADIGGATPGSTPPGSTRLEEEGVVLNDVLLVSRGEFREAEMRQILCSASFPARKPDANIADLRAQAAANHAGIAELAQMVGRYSWPVVAAYMHHVQANAEESVRRVIDRLHDGAFDYTMDDGALLRVAIRVDRAARSATIDFTGTSAQRSGNFNAPPAVTRAAVLYVFRCLVKSDLPLNEGCLAPLRIVVPDGTFLSPAPGAAVVAGNTEVSQAIVNALIGALGVSAASQGTMNNLLLGNKCFQYYETICGGAGAGPDYDGASAVQTHMTNTRITDPEEFELRCPVRLEVFEIRRGSGGGGLHGGGDGVIRRIRVNEPCTLSLVSSRRTTGPFGAAGGDAGSAGQQWIDRADGSRQTIPGVAERELASGDAVTIETPGGGGYGCTGELRIAPTTDVATAGIGSIGASV